jgi:hypothetical protein
VIGTLVVADQRREMRNWAARRPGKDRAQRLGLFLISTFIDVGRDGPVFICHWTGRMGREYDGQTVKGGPFVAAGIDLEDQHDIALTLRGA